jgi:transcriptional regulator with XRE-family HTH domain
MISKSDDSADRRVRINVRFACWELDARRERWPALLAGWLGTRPGNGPAAGDDNMLLSEGVLSDLQSLSHDQVRAVADALSRDVQELFFEDWPQSKPGLVLHQNLRRLLADPGEQTKAQLAEELGVSPATLSRWIGGSQLPDTTARGMIANLFGLRNSEELEVNPLFLSYLPVTHGERVAWLGARLRAMSRRELHELFPALMRIFSPANGNLGLRSPERSELKRFKDATLRR